MCPAPWLSSSICACLPRTCQSPCTTRADSLWAYSPLPSTTPPCSWSEPRPTKSSLRLCTSLAVKFFKQKLDFDVGGKLQPFKIATIRQSQIYGWETCELQQIQLFFLGFQNFQLHKVAKCSDCSWCFPPKYLNSVATICTDFYY